jgi:hypothetical protein
MSFCWKMLIPLTLLNLLVTATLLLAFPTSIVPVAIANWLMLIGFAFAVPVLQRRRLRSLRARLASRAAA